MLYEEDDSAELDAIIRELREFKIQFEGSSNSVQSSSSSPLFHLHHSLKHRNMDSVECLPKTLSSSSSSSSASSSASCVYELRTLEDQLEAALASLTMTVNGMDTLKTNEYFCTTKQIQDFAQQQQQQQQRSSNSSACSSGLGDEITNGLDESLHMFNVEHQHNVEMQENISATLVTVKADDCDSAFSESGSIPPNGILKINDDTLTNRKHMARETSKILVRTCNDDGSTKSILIDETMTIRDILFILVHKNHREPDVDFSLVEILPDLHMERIFEDHQKLTEAILMWPSISTNRLLFTKRTEKYALFQTVSCLNEKLEKNGLVLNHPIENDNLYDELFKTPDIEGIIYLKEKSRKSWKKHFCVLRSSGLYYIPKGKSKKDLVSLAKFENVELFFGVGWKKKFKSPSDYCFALKHPLIQKKSSKYIKYMCVETKKEFDRWIASIRIAKFARQLQLNYFLMQKAMNMYRSSGRFAAVCAARGRGDQIDHDCPPTPSMSKKDNHQNNNKIVQCHEKVNINSHIENDNKISDSSLSTNSPLPSEINSSIKSASYMDELRQRLERVLSDPTSPTAIKQQNIENTPVEDKNHSFVINHNPHQTTRLSGLPVSKSFRLQPSSTTKNDNVFSCTNELRQHQTHSYRLPANNNNSSTLKPTLLKKPNDETFISNTEPSKCPIMKSRSQVPLKNTTETSSLSTRWKNRPTVAPPKLKQQTSLDMNGSNTKLHQQSTENLSKLNVSSSIVASTPLPRKQLPFQMSDKTFSMLNGFKHKQNNSNNNDEQQMSRSFIIQTTKHAGRYFIFNNSNIRTLIVITYTELTSHTLSFEYNINVFYLDRQRANNSSGQSKTDSLNLDDTDLLPLPSPTFLEGLNEQHQQKKLNQSAIINSSSLMQHNGENKTSTEKLSSISPPRIQTTTTNFSILSKSTTSTQQKQDPNKLGNKSNSYKNTTTINKKMTLNDIKNRRIQPSAPPTTSSSSYILNNHMDTKKIFANRISSSSQQIRLSKSHTTTNVTASISSSSLNKQITPMTPVKPVPPVPPRKSSIPRPSFANQLKPLPPQRDLTTSLKIVSHF
ncbi:unnamed protein product [Didymodactylos carnosus]|uniref:Uncharacterized protein n=1 Tax=Didymodactylos carnosus TaxID=1234261 RepID=A0A814Q777_9BILA|nr:unnamed protein product [Didymodactylos carnosus]CAF3879901.1 unnamed protein product [Didymodactylos carnosus]